MHGLPLACLKSGWATSASVNQDPPITSVNAESSFSTLTASASSLSRVKAELLRVSLARENIDDCRLLISKMMRRVLWMLVSKESMQSRTAVALKEDAPNSPLVKYVGRLISSACSKRLLVLLDSGIDSSSSTDLRSYRRRGMFQVARWNSFPKDLYMDVKPTLI